MPNHASEVPKGEPSRELQAMWRSLLGASWQALGVVPADTETPVDRVIGAFRSIAGSAGAEDLEFVDARGVAVARGAQLADELASLRDRSRRVVVIVDSVLMSLAGIPLLRHVDAIVLVVRLGASTPDSIGSTVQAVGAERILGSVAVPEDG